MTGAVDLPELPVNHHADHRGFSGFAGYVFGVTLLPMGHATARFAADLMQVSDADTVVDIGCGPGVAVREAARRGAAAVGVDPAPELLRIARALSRHETVAWATGTAEQVPLPDQTATVVWALATVHHWQDAAAGVSEMYRLLQPGGRLLAAERQVKPGATGLASHGWIRQQAESFAVLCDSAGFRDITMTGHRAGRRDVWAVRASRP